MYDIISFIIIVVICTEVRSSKIESETIGRRGTPISEFGN